MDRTRRVGDERGRRLATYAVAVLGPIATALALVAVRSEIDSANLALVLVLVVVAVAILGGGRAGAIAAVAAALSFDFFLVKPYLSMDVDSSDDVETVLVLLAVGLLVGAVASRARRAEQRHDDAAAAIARIRAVADLVAQNAPIDAVASEVTQQLRDLMSLDDCWLEFPPFLYVMPRLERYGGIESSEHWLSTDGLVLSSDGIELPVLERGVERARFVMVGDPAVNVSIEARIAAVALADQLGAALAMATPEQRDQLAHRSRRQR